MKFNFLFKSFIVGFLVVFFASCDKDINEIGAGIVGDDHYGLNLNNTSTVVAYNQSLGEVQTNDLPINQFGYYNNPVFGKTKASFVTQLTLATNNPIFYNPATIVVDSVYLYVPYYSTFVSTDTDSGDSTYSLDSIQGSEKVKVKLYESNKFIEDFDYTNAAAVQQNYYSNDQSFENNHGSILLNDKDKNIFDQALPADNSQNDEFIFSNKQIKFYKKNSDGTPGNPQTGVVRTRLAPGLFMNLNETFFKNKIVNAPVGKLYNFSTFKEYFRGIYFQVDNAAASANQGSLAMMNFSKGVITMIYHDQTSATDVTSVRKTIEMKLGGHSVNLLQNEFVNPITAPNTTQGDSNLYLKGGNGSMAVIDLFGGQANTTSNIELQKMRDEKWLINEANLTFYINQTDVGTTMPEPNRILLYDLTNKRPLLDYYTDFTTNSNIKFAKGTFGGILVNNDSKIINKKIGERGTKYKIRITNYLRSLVKYGGNIDVTKDSTNVRLGLVVTENINTASGSTLLNPFTTGGNLQTKYIPVMSVVNPLGTILYGTSSSVPADKKIKLEIYYTKPD